MLKNFRYDINALRALSVLAVFICKNTAFAGVEELGLQDIGNEDNKIKFFNKLKSLYLDADLKYVIFSIRKAGEVLFLKTSIEQALVNGKVVIFVLQVPLFKHHVVDCLSFDKSIFTFAKPRQFKGVKCGFEPDPLLESKSKQIDEIIALAKKYKNLHIFNPYQYMLKDGICDSTGCFATYKTKMLYMNHASDTVNSKTRTNHLSQDGAGYIAPYFVDFLQNIDKK